MIVDDSDLGILFTLKQGNDDLKGKTIVHVLHQNGYIFHKGMHAVNLLGRDLGNNLQFLAGITCNNAGNRSCGDALHMVSIGHDNTLNVLNNAAAGTNHDLVRHCTQNFSCLGSAVSQCDGFCTAHSRNKLFFEDVDICAVFQIILCHDKLPPFSQFLHKRTVVLPRTKFKHRDQ